MKYLLFCFFTLTGFLSFSQTTKDPSKHARGLSENEQFEQALLEVDQLIKKDPGVADYYDFRAEVYFRLKLFREALADQDKAVSLKPEEAMYYHHRANFYYSLQHPDEAIEDNNRALQFIKEDTIRFDIILNRGACYGMKREFQKAYEDYLTVLTFDSTNLPALTNIGAVLDELGRADEAIAYLQKAIRLYPNDIASYANLAFQYMQRGDYEKALELNNKVLQMDPGTPLAYNNRGFVKYKLNDLKGAMEDVNHSLQLYPENSYAYKNRALIYIALNNFQKPARICKRP